MKPQTNPTMKPDVHSASHRSPILIESALAVSKISILVTGISTAVLSALAGAPIFIIALRSGVAIIGLGLILWAMNYALARATLRSVREQIEKALQADIPQGSSTEWEA
ncbi:MAG TPA: hypothetical protein ENL35_12465 [Chloroflexi bacterium]|nr:hypothetical protein [Chloroflexota bacterium]